MKGVMKFYISFEFSFKKNLDLNKDVGTDEQLIF